MKKDTVETLAIIALCVSVIMALALVEVWVLV